MTPNVGTIDRIIRLLLAATIGALFFLGVLKGTSAIVLLVFSAIFLVTGIVRFCPLYKPLGIRTLKRNRHS